jgi:hypothetical protein
MQRSTSRDVRVLRDLARRYAEIARKDVQGGAPPALDAAQRPPTHAADRDGPSLPHHGRNAAGRQQYQAAGNHRSLTADSGHARLTCRRNNASQVLRMSGRGPAFDGLPVAMDSASGSELVIYERKEHRS